MKHRDLPLDMPHPSIDVKIDPSISSFTDTLFNAKSPVKTPKPEAPAKEKTNSAVFVK